MVGAEYGLCLDVVRQNKNMESAFGVSKGLPPRVRAQAVSATDEEGSTYQPNKYYATKSGKTAILRRDKHHIVYGPAALDNKKKKLTVRPATGTVRLQRKARKEYLNSVKGKKEYEGTLGGEPLKYVSKSMYSAFGVEIPFTTIQKDRASRVEGLRAKYHHPSTPDAERTAAKEFLDRMGDGVGDPPTTERVRSTGYPGSKPKTGYDKSPPTAADYANKADNDAFKRKYARKAAWRAVRRDPGVRMSAGLLGVSAAGIGATMYADHRYNKKHPPKKTFAKALIKPGESDKYFASKGERVARRRAAAPYMLGGLGSGLAGIGGGLALANKGKNKAALGTMAVGGIGDIALNQVGNYKAHRAGNNWRRASGLPDRDFKTGQALTQKKKK